MRRREFVGLIGGAAVWPVITASQELGRIRKLDVLLNPSEGDTSMIQRLAALMDGLAGHGWINGRTIAVNVHPGTPDLVTLRTTIQQVVSTSPDLIIVQGNPVVAALRNVDRRIPTVFIQVGDPVGSGFVNSLSRPGGNLTGFSAAEPSVGGKWLELLREFLPSVSHVGVLFDRTIAANLRYLDAVEAAALTHKVGVSRFPIHETASIAAAFSSMAGRAEGVILLPSPATGSNPHRELIAQLGVQYRLPTIGSFRYLAASGCLASYGPDLIDLFRRGASYCDRILRGELPGELPIQQPTKYEFVINLKTAKALGLIIPESFLLRADEVIE